MLLVKTFHLPDHHIRYFEYAMLMALPYCTIVCTQIVYTIVYRLTYSFPAHPTTHSGPHKMSKLRFILLSGDNFLLRNNIDNNHNNCFTIEPCETDTHVALSVTIIQTLCAILQIIVTQTNWQYV